MHFFLQSQPSKTLPASMSDPELTQEEPKKAIDPFSKDTVTQSDRGDGSPSPSPSEKENLEQIKAAAEFSPDWRFYLAFVSLAILTLMVALDATSISVALPVRHTISSFLPSFADSHRSLPASFPEPPSKPFGLERRSS